MDRKYWRGRVLDPGPDEPDPGDDLGPDERDADLLDDSWENAYLRGERPRRFSWMQATIVVLSILALAGILLPMALVVTR